MSLKEDILRGVDQYISATRESIETGLNNIINVSYSHGKGEFDEDYSRLWDLMTFRKQFANVADGVFDYNKDILAEIIEQLMLLEEDA